MHLAFNSTVVALVPKGSNVTTMSGFPPISCCSVVYKVVTKNLANRLKLFLPGLTKTNQSAFVRGRCISDNILLAQELKSISPRCALKVDLQKAFDSIDWGFFMKVLKAAKIPDLLFVGLGNVLQNPYFQYQ